MLDNEIIKTIQSMPDSEKGGDNALDGFEFQISSAIYLMFKEIGKKRRCALVYEKIEDFIIFTDQIKLYQAKSISRNLTANVLYSKPKKVKDNKSGLSIIEKMHNNYSSIKSIFPDYVVHNNLIICENQIFSRILTEYDCTKLKKLNFDSLKDKTKEEIIANTGTENYDWENMNVIRLIPKNRHEEVTRAFIEDTIKDIKGDNKIDSLALYNALTNEIRKIRRNKEKLTSEFIERKINKFAVFEENLKYTDYIHFLNDDDKINIKININFDIFKNSITIKNDASTEDYNLIKNYYENNNCNNLYEVFKGIEKNTSFENMFLRLSDDEIKALILLVIAKEMN
ncbi:dsDNA nuclease domain-containing protein [Clostridium perfringens]|uniref:dsDNA nuclease domain-containing protein n=1 Tax=Clostridium perfringens TaxID=1502 RepID=UPI0018E43E13|nr:dsDNA nuclease domain-containing protein [Clostridium perfringens]MBI6012526.1 DUF4297 domain-containing protein [Clostridium perfringens]MDM0687615.1 dsDNA nuclease domain-containing protein [Clostridium perfringens]CAG9359587.1 Uncharacterised protein [Clostridium perfringens]HAT4226513.1 DUF4297 domain-containing protein [Clostridium perfringens]HBI7032841.1 DUF4297 domain-containing protein [Clostridium perfringens]